MVHIRRIREKVEDNPSNPEYLLTIRGLGYKLMVKGNSMEGTVRILKRFIGATMIISIFVILNFILLGIWVFKV